MAPHLQRTSARLHALWSLLLLLFIANACKKPTLTSAAQAATQSSKEHNVDGDGTGNPLETTTIADSDDNNGKEKPGDVAAAAAGDAAVPSTKQQPHHQRAARQTGAGDNTKDSLFNGDGGGGIYWLAADGPELQMWPALGGGAGTYGSGLQQSSGQIGGGGGQQPFGQQQQSAQQAVMLQRQQQPAQQQQQGQMALGTAPRSQPPSSMVVPQQQQTFFMGQPANGAAAAVSSAFPAYGQQQQQQQIGVQPGELSPYAGYLEKQISSYPVMIYTLADCIPCQRAKHLLAVHYPDVRAHYLELSGNEPWQQQLQIDLQYLTGAITFPYIFVCGNYIGGQSELFEMHETGQLRRLIAQCLKPAPK